MNRFQAFLIHMGISLVIFAILAYLVVYVWYPDFFFTADGGWQGMRIIVLVDLVLGPALTLVVFNRNKPRTELRRDLSIIGTVQALCLTAGVYVVYMERPLALVYSDGRFYSMSADDYRDAGIEPPSFEGIPGPYPKRVMVQLPDDLTEQSQVRGSALRNRVPLAALPEHYVPLNLDVVADTGDALSDVDLEHREQSTGDLSTWLAAHGGTANDYAFFPFGARYGILVLGVSRQEDAIVGLMESDLRKDPDTAEPETSDS